MAAHTQFPPPGAEPQVRGDPATMILRFRANGVDTDITGSTWRSFVRDAIDGNLIAECEDFTITTPAAYPTVFPGDPSSTPCVLVLAWSPDQTWLWESGFVADVEQLTPVKFTPIIFDQLRIDRDVSNTPELP